MVRVVEWNILNLSTHLWLVMGVKPFPHDIVWILGSW